MVKTKKINATNGLLTEDHRSLLTALDFSFEVGQRTPTHERHIETKMSSDLDKNHNIVWTRWDQGFSSNLGHLPGGVQLLKVSETWIAINFDCDELRHEKESIELEQRRTTTILCREQELNYECINIIRVNTGCCQSLDNSKQAKLAELIRDARRNP